VNLPRPVASAVVNLGVGLGATVVALGLGAFVISMAGASPVEAYQAVWDGAFGSRPQLANTMQKTVPLLLVALGWIVAFTAKRINIGLEGQVIVGALCATAVGIQVDLPLPLALVLAMGAGSLGGALWCGIAAWLWARRGVNEIISTLMLNLIAVQLSAWLLRGPLAGGNSDVVRSEPVADGSRWPVMWERTPLTWAVILVPVAAVSVWFVLQHTVFGYRARFVGANASAARVGGVPTEAVAVKAMLWSGALAGAAGGVLVLGSQSSALTDNIAGGVGYSGIVAGLLAGGSAIGSIFSSLLLAALAQGGGLMEARTSVPAEVTGVIQASVILLVAASSVGAQWLLRRLTAGPPATPSLMVDLDSPSSTSPHASDEREASDGRFDEPAEVR
jgi:ABC-type uncharacterized transport system permease subunit